MLLFHRPLQKVCFRRKLFLRACFPHPAIDRAIFPVCHCVFAVRLIGKNLVIGNCVRRRPHYLACKHPHEIRMPAKYKFLLMVNVQNIELALSSRHALAPSAQKSSHHRRAKRIEHKSNARASRNFEFHCIPAYNSNWRNSQSACLPASNISSRNPRQLWVQLYPNYFAERELRRQQKSSAHARSQIDKSKLINRARRF